MADLIGTPVATQIKPMPGMSLSEIVNMASGLQSLQQAARVNPLVLEQQKVATESAKMGLSEKKFKKIADSQISMINNPLVIRAEQDPSSVDPKMLADLVLRNGLETAKGVGIPEDQAKQYLQPYIDRAMQEPGNLRGYYKERHILGLDQVAQTQALTPTLKEIKGFAPTGEQVTQGVNINPFAGPVGQPVGPSSFAGPGMDMQLTGETDPKTGEPVAVVRDARTGAIRRVTVPGGMFGTPPTFGGGAPAGQMPGAGPGVMTESLPPGAGAAGRVPVGPPPPVPPYGAPTVMSPYEKGMSGQLIKSAEEDWIATQERNKLAQQNIATFQKIKSLIPESFTGVGGSAKQFASALAQSIGVPLNVLETASTEELMKNTKLLQLAGGNTDAARSIAEMANPSAKMTKEGLLRVTNQLISFEKMAQARTRFLQPYASNANDYTAARQQFDALADPRMFQEMSADDVRKMKAGMSEAEQAELTAKIKAARQLGIL